MLLPRLIQTRLGKGPEIFRKASAGVLAIRRWAVQSAHSGDSPPSTLFIFGCQRSGTTLLSRIFDGDAFVYSFAEHSKALTRDDHDYRTRSLTALEHAFARCSGRLIVSKPLVESHRAVEFLDYFDSSHIIWSYRHYRDVVRSFVKLFGQAGVNILAKIMHRADNWASEDVSHASRQIVERFYSPKMALNDAAAVFWLLRNALYFEQRLEENPRVQMCRYSDLVTSPDATMRRIYDFVDLPYPGSYLVGGIHAESRGLGQSLPLQPEIEALCEDMWRRLRQADQTLKREVTFAHMSTNGTGR